MLSYVITVVLMSLWRFHTEVKFRQNLRCDAKLISRPQIIGVRRSDQFYQLHLYPLRTDFLQIGGKRLHRLPGRLLNPKAELGRKAHRTKHAQSVLVKSLSGNPHTAYHPVFYVRKTAVKIHQTGARIVSHSVDCKIPSFQIFF